MAKTTKSVVPIRSLQKFHKSNTVNSITLVGATDLADIDIDGRGDVLFNLNRDNTKIDKVETTSDLITVKNYPGTGGAVIVTGKQIGRAHV